MKLIFLIFLLSIFLSCLAEIPLTTCKGLKPFRKGDGCENFSSICVKNDDDSCKTFLDICQQCPAMNYSVLMFQDIALIKVELQETKANFNKTTDDMKKELNIITKQLRNNENKTNNVYILLWVIIGINILLIIILIVEIRFKLFTKIRGHKTRKEKNPNYELLESRKSFKLKNIYEGLKYIMNDGFENIVNKIESKMDDKFSKLFECLEVPKEKKSRKIKFHINGYMKPVELILEEEESIVEIKKEICSKLTKCNPNDYKILKLKINQKQLNDNGYLPFTEISSSNENLCGEFDKTIDASNIVVLKMEIDFNLSKLIQVDKNQSFKNLVLSDFGIDNSENFNYFIENNNNNNNTYTELEKEKTIKELKLQDDDTIFVIKRSIEELNLESIFERETISIEFANTDKISVIKQSVANNFNCSSNDIVMFLKNLHLDENMFAFQLLSKSYGQVKYCRLINFDLADVEIKTPALVLGCFSELFKAEFLKKHQDILIKKYDIKMSERFEDCNHIISELKTFQITKSENRFVKLFGVYKSNNLVYVSMENMSEGSLKMFLKNNTNNGINLNLIAKWTAQILEGLNFLHRNNIIHRDLNPSSLLLDSKQNIKLSSFNLSKYSEFHSPSSIDVHNPNLKGFPIQYLAPEIIFMEISNSQTDVWSLGAILIRIYTKKNPYSGVKREYIINRIERNNHKIYECPDSMPVELKEFIDLCIKDNPNERATVQNLQKDKFIRYYYKS